MELDEITNEREEAEKMGATKEQLKTLSTDTVYKIDVPANRYDLLCNEGLSRAIRIFLGEQDAPIYTLKEPASGKREIMTVKVRKRERRGRGRGEGSGCQGILFQGVV